MITTVFTGLFADNYPDQHYVLQGEELFLHAEKVSGIRATDDGRSISLEEGYSMGYIIFESDSADYPFNRGLPSWNGTAPDVNSGFMVQMRFPYGNGWSPWLTVGFWKAYIWNSYGTTSYGGGFIDYDYVKLSEYRDKWQFKILMARISLSEESPTVSKLSFFASDTRTTDATDYTMLLNDKPAEILIPTEFLYQYGIDDEIGPSICSPTSVSMVLKSYHIEVDPLQFARDTRDPYWGIFGIWPRVVQNASEFGLDGAVTRYRTWSETREVLANGGRIVISVGPPLYTGHLMMLAGFTSGGSPIVHDPARSNGYAYVYDKNELAHSWFEKGGIAYTFFQADSQLSAFQAPSLSAVLPENFHLHQNYPNPFNTGTRIPFTLTRPAEIEMIIFDARGRKVRSIYQGTNSAGTHSVYWNASHLPSGSYYIQMLAGSVYRKTIKAVIIK